MASVSQRQRTSASPFQVGDWTCVSRLATGRWADVFLARPAHCDPSWPADYVLKIARREDLELAAKLIVREAQVAMQVDHPRVISLLSSDLEADRPYLVMPRVGQLTLDHVVSCSAVRVADALWFVRQTAEAAVALHDQGWLHSDIHPGNIVISPEGTVTLLDLGLACRPEDESMISSVVAGRLPYIAPEMFSSTLFRSFASDVYSLGTVLFQLLTGRLPLTADAPGDWVDAHRSRRPLDIRAYRPEIPKEIAQLVRVTLAKQPERRPAAHELLRDLTRLEITHLPAA